MLIIRSGHLHAFAPSFLSSHHHHLHHHRHHITHHHQHQHSNDALSSPLPLIFFLSLSFSHYSLTTDHAFVH